MGFTHSCVTHYGIHLAPPNQLFTLISGHCLGVAIKASEFAAVAVLVYHFLLSSVVSYLSLCRFLHLVSHVGS